MESGSTQAVLPLVGLAADQIIGDRYRFQAVASVRVESGSTQAVLPLVGLAADRVIGDRYNWPIGRGRGGVPDWQVPPRCHPAGRFAFFRNRGVAAGQSVEAGLGALDFKHPGGPRRMCGIAGARQLRTAFQPSRIGT
ncbi:MAG: hypothetical protein R6U98_31065 [Pirellulaceae bacterium]